MKALWRRWGHRWGTWTVIGYVVLALGLALAFRLRDQDLEQELVRFCTQGNTFRHALVEALRQGDRDLIAASQESAETEKLTPAERAERQHSIDAYLARREKSYAPLKPRDCGRQAR